MTARLITITPDAEKTMAYIARVSSPNQENPAIAGLLAYCIRHGHWSVFEHAYATLEIETSRAIARQIIRHRSFVFSEFSQRYSAVNSDYIKVEARRQDTKNRQASHDDLPSEVTKWFEFAQVAAYDKAMTVYREALRKGIAKESARALLPEGMTLSRLYVTGSVRSWLHYLAVRLAAGTQKEHRIVAQECRGILEPLLPATFQAASTTLFQEVK